MRRFLLISAAAVAVALPTTPAAADPALEVTDVVVDASLRSLDLTVHSVGLPEDTGLDSGAVTVAVDGRTLPATVAVAEEARAVSVLEVLLVVDTSGSMLGQPMAEAKQAITTFVSQSAPEIEIGLLTFSSKPRLEVEPTTDRARLLAAVSGMRAQGETALYDAAVAASQALGAEGDRRLVVLSDGGDTRSEAGLQQALDAVSGSGVTVDAIGFRTDESVAGTLEQLATAGRGRVHAAQTAAELSAALDSTSQPHARALTLHVLVPEDLRGEHTLHVQVGSPAGPLTTTADVPLGASTAGQAAPSGWWGTREALLAGTAAIGASLLLGSLALLGGDRRGRRKVNAVLERYTTVPQPQKESLRTASPVTRTALGIADRVATSRDLQDKLSARLDRAAVALTPAEWVLLCAGVTVGTTLLLVVLGWNLLLALLVAGLLGWLGPRTYPARRGSRRQKAFEERLPDALQMVAGSLSAGYSLAQALDGVVREGTEPLATEFGRALAESRLGVPVETTLQAVADRMASRDFGWVVMAIRVQREVGGNLAGILTTVTATMRERAMLKRHVRALSAEGRLSAYILLGLPVFLFLFMLTARREYLEPMYTTGLGIALIAVAAVLMGIGSFAMSRMVKVEV